jgi:Animal haem peroxidase
MLDASIATATEVKPERNHCLAPSRTVDAPLEGASGRYERLFPELEPLGGDGAQLLEFAVVGGVCDGGTSCEDARETAAGWPFLGQFIAHDITADRSELARHTDGTHLLNFRTPRANLECLYGAGPVGNPYLYSRDDPAKLLLGRNDAGEEADLPRNPEGIALVGDPRNDSHLFMTQLHVAMLRMHNCLVDHLRAHGVAEHEVFDRARREVSWHYQWVVIHDYLPTLVGAGMVNELLTEGPRFYRVDGTPRIPLEFADGAFRYGHSQIRNDYVLNQRSGAHRLFPELLGFAPVPASRRVEWSLFFDVPGRPPAQRAKRIDGRLARSLIELPTALTGESDEQAYQSLAGRDLQRGHAYGLPSGEAVASAMGEPPLSAEEVGLADVGWEWETPLWFYVLRESEARGDGERLGPVGGRIVAEVLLGIIDGDPESYRAVEPEWQPALPARGERFELTDILVPSE